MQQKCILQIVPSNLHWLLHGVVPVGQDTMQLWLVSMRYLLDRTLCIHGQCQCGTCWTGHYAVMVSVSVLPVRQDTVQSCLVSVWYLMDRTLCIHGQCQCGTCWTGHYSFMANVSAVPVRQNTVQSWPVSVWVCQLGHNAVTFHSQSHTQFLTVANLCYHNIPSVSLIQNSHLVPVSM
jgi:hypothetical protein